MLCEDVDIESEEMCRSDLMSIQERVEQNVRIELLTVPHSTAMRLSENATHVAIKLHSFTTLASDIGHGICSDWLVSQSASFSDTRVGQSCTLRRL